MYHHQGRLDEAERYLHDSLDLLRRIGDRTSEAHTLRSLGDVYVDLPRLDEAVACFRKCLPMLEGVGDRRREALAWQSLGDVY